MTLPLLRAEDLHKAYREGATSHPVLRGAEIEVDRGEFVALVGPSGSGKSTLLNLLGGIERPDAGRVHLGDEELTALDERGRTLLRRCRIGFVFQFYNLIPTLTVEENLLLPLELLSVDDGEARGRAAELLGTVGLGDRGDSFPDRLSGGEQQRVALARALVHRPDVILADEPTGNLDEETGEGVMELLEALVREEGCALLLVTHNRAQASRGDRVLRIREGAVEPLP